MQNVIVHPEPCSICGEWKGRIIMRRGRATIVEVLRACVNWHKWTTIEPKLPLAIAMSILALSFAGCTACDIKSGDENCISRNGRPRGLTERDWHTHLKARGFSFWQRNDDKPFSAIPAAIEGLRQFDY